MAAEDNKDMTLVRELNAPVELVWKAWTDASLMAKWWGPDHVSIPDCQFDARPGGKIYIVMLAGKELGPMAGQRWPMHGTVKEVVPMKKIVYTSTAFEEPDGTANLENEVTATFEEVNGKTKLTVHFVVTRATEKAAPALAGARMGWNQQMDKLVAFIDKGGR